MYIHGFRSLKNAVCKLRDWYVVDQTILRYRIEANWFGLVLFPVLWISQAMSTRMRFQMSPFSLNRKRIKIFASTRSFLQRFCLSTRQR